MFYEGIVIFIIGFCFGLYASRVLNVFRHTRIVIGNLFLLNSSDLLLHEFFPNFQQDRSFKSLLEDFLEILIQIQLLSTSDDRILNLATPLHICCELIIADLNVLRDE